jgi:hypothetical protein
VRLALITACAAVVWLVVLPRVGEVEHVRAMIDHNEARGVDPSAKFYSELPMMPRVRERIRGVKEGITTEDTEGKE